MKKEESGRMPLPDDSPYLQGMVVRKSTYKKIIKNQYVITKAGPGMLYGKWIDPPVHMRGCRLMLHRKYELKPRHKYGYDQARGWQIRVFKRYLRMSYATILSNVDADRVMRKFEYWTERTPKGWDYCLLGLVYQSVSKTRVNQGPVYIYLFGKKYGPMKNQEQINVLKSLRAKLNKLDNIEIQQSCANDGWVPDHYDLELIKGGTSY